MDQLIEYQNFSSVWFCITAQESISKQGIYIWTLTSCNRQRWVDEPERTIFPIFPENNHSSKDICKGNFAGLSNIWIKYLYQKVHSNDICLQYTRFQCFFTGLMDIRNDQLLPRFTLTLDQRHLVLCMDKESQHHKWYF